MPALQGIEGYLGAVRCDLKDPKDHNITNVDLPSLTRALVGVVQHGTRIMASIGFLHHPTPVIREPDLKETWELARARATCTEVTFELNTAPSLKAAEWPPFPETEVMNIQPKKIKGRRRLKECNRAVKVASSLRAPRFRKKRPPPRFCASYPPVSHAYMLTRPDTYRGWIYFSMIPDLLNEVVSEALRWRHFSVMTGLPHFPTPPSSERFFRRYFRWVIGSYHSANNYAYFKCYLNSALCPGSPSTQLRRRSSAIMSSPGFSWAASRTTGT